jgi:DNA-binding response OmpR family regulator
MEFEEFDIVLCRTQIAELRKYTKSMTVLVAEDYPVLQKSLENIFSSLFLEVAVASDGVEALQLYKNKMADKKSYDIVFSDIAMPNMDGIKLTKRIKEINHNQIIIIFSAHQDSNYLLELINLDVRRFILKPISLKNLLDELLLTCRAIYDEKNLSNIIMLDKNISYHKNERKLFINDAQSRLSSNEELILELFIRNINQTVSNEEITNYLYLNGIDIESENVRKTVYKLRKKLPESLIQNTHSIGYSIKTTAF